jgi:predicted DNA-binding protein with PD1-like motif
VERRKLMCTLSEALEAIRTVNSFYEARSENMKIISGIGKIDDLEKQYWTKRKQKKTTDFFI